MNDKPRIPPGSYVLQATYADHAKDCVYCKQVDFSKPGTIRYMCLAGAVLYKRENGVSQRKEREIRDQNLVSKAEAKRLMRYVGDEA